jgi:hypothetical protein
MFNRTARRRGNDKRRFPTLAIVVAAAAAVLFTALGGSAVAAKGLIHAADIATGAVTSETIKDGAIKPQDLNRRTKASLRGARGVMGTKGDNGLTGSTGNGGAAGLTGTSGANGANGANGPNGANGSDGTDGIHGTDGANGTDGIDGTDGIHGTDGTNGRNGTDGIDGIVAPLSTTAGPTALPTASPPTVVVNMVVPADDYVVLAKTQLSHTGAGDTVDCVLKAGTTTLDQVSMKTLPALAAIPVSLQAVTTTSPTQLSVECDVLTANGSANFSSLIAIPTG